MTRVLCSALLLTACYRTHEAPRFDAGPPVLPSVDAGAHDAGGTDAGGPDAGARDAGGDVALCAHDRGVDGSDFEADEPVQVDRVCARLAAATVEVVIEGTSFGCAIPDAACAPGPVITTRRCLRRCGAGVDRFRLELSCPGPGRGDSLLIDGERVFRFAGFETCAELVGDEWVVAP